MPELPEVETTRQGIAPHVRGRCVEAVHVYESRLRRRVPAVLRRELPGQRIEAVCRRGKYLLLVTRAGTVLIHLGMSGSLRLVPRGSPRERHEHVEICLVEGRCLRFRDPRRFGLVLWVHGDPLDHPLLRDLGPEPLCSAFDGTTLYERARGRRQAVKTLLMDGRVVAGIGNIYANEALFRAGIYPARPAGRISWKRYRLLTEQIRQVLREAMTAGGCTLRDFTDGKGRPGYFARHLLVYGRAGAPCMRCGAPIRRLCLGQRATYYCPHCQY